MNEEILRVTPDGEFFWHNNADKLIETGDFTEAPAMPHILRRLRRLSVVEAQRDALLEALRQIVEQHGQWNNGIWAANIARAAIALVEGRVKAVEENT